MTADPAKSIVDRIDLTSCAPRPPLWPDDRAAPALHEETLTGQPARVDVVSGADPAVKGFRSAFRDLLDRAGL